MKRNYLIISVFICLFVAYVTFNLIMEKSLAYSNNELLSFDYEITFIDSYGGLYGTSNDGKGVYFTSELLVVRENLKLGDKVKAWFPIGKYDSVVKVEKLN